MKDHCCSFSARQKATRSSTILHEIEQPSRCQAWEMRQSTRHFLMAAVSRCAPSPAPSPSAGCCRKTRWYRWRSWWHRNCEIYRERTFVNAPVSLGSHWEPVQNIRIDYGGRMLTRTKAQCFLLAAVLLSCFGVSLFGQTQVASLRPHQGLRWHRISPTAEQPDGPVLYQLLFNANGI